MGLEVGTFVNDLVTTNPVGGTDPKSQGDDHFRLIKTVLKNTFPLALGARKFSDTDAGALDTLNWLLFRDSASPLANDLLASYAISGRNSAAAEVAYARLQGQILDPTNGSEDAAWLVKAMVGGVETQLAALSGLGLNFAFPLIGAGRPPTFQVITVGGVGAYVRPPTCTRLLMWGCGGGGAGGGVAGPVGVTAGAGGGGGPGNASLTDIINPGSDFTGDVTIGAGGVANAGATGGNGGNTSVTINGITYTWTGGTGGIGGPSFNSTIVVYDGGQVNGAPTNMLIGLPSVPGERGMANVGSPTSFGWGGIGGTSIGGPGARVTQIGNGATAGNAPAATAWGAGGGGAALVTANTNVAGGAGRQGAVFFLEFY